MARARDCQAGLMASPGGCLMLRFWPGHEGLGPGKGRDHRPWGNSIFLLSLKQQAHKALQTLHPQRLPQRPAAGLPCRALVSFVYMPIKKIKAAVILGALAHT